jgi:hypothetical protein
MNDTTLPEQPPDLAAADAPAPRTEHMLAELEQRVHQLEESVAQLQDTRQLEERITERVSTRLPPEPPPPPEPPGLSVVQSSWLFVELVQELRAMLAMFFDARYHIAWITRVAAIVLLAAMLTSSWWFPLSLVPVIGTYLDKLLDLVLALVLFFLLSREVRRYREWRWGRRL